MKVAAMIPARAGSKRIHRKNLAWCGGRPLVAWTIDAALQAERVDVTIVSTECPEIAECARTEGAYVLHRPPELATDTASSDDVLVHAAQHIDADTLVMLQPTSPLRNHEWVDRTIEALVPGKQAAVTVVSDPHATFRWDQHWGASWTEGWEVTERPRTQDAEYLRENGACYAVRREALMATGNRYGTLEPCIDGGPALVEMPRWCSLDVDDHHDLNVADWILMRQTLRRNPPHSRPVKEWPSYRRKWEVA